MPAYFVVRTLCNIDGTRRGYKLKLGDVIKFGRVVFIVKEIYNKIN